MILKKGEKLHVITRRAFENDLRRHFVGEVESAGDSTVRVKGYAFVYHNIQSEYIRKPELRTRILSLTDVGNVINVIPHGTDISDLSYKVTSKGTLVVTDDKDFSLDINEFSAFR